MGKITLIWCYLLFLNKKGLYIKLHVLIPHNKKVWLNEKINIY